MLMNPIHSLSFCTLLIGLVLFSSPAYSQDNWDYEQMMREQEARRLIIPCDPYVAPCADGSKPIGGIWISRTTPIGGSRHSRKSTWRFMI